MSIKTINALTLLTPSTIDVENDSVALGDASAGDNARMAFANVAGMIPFAVCNSAAADQAKYISLPGLVISDAVAVEVCVQFTYANTAGTITSGTNVVSDNTAPYFIINNDTTKHYKITVAGENAGSGFNKAGERQKFIIYGGTADSETAASVYSVSDTSSSYLKQRDGHIEYYNTPEIISKTIENGHSYSTPDLSSWSAGILVIGGGIGYYSVYEYHKLNIAFMNKISGNYDFSVSISNGIITIINNTGDAVVVKMFYYSGY